MSIISLGLAENYAMLGSRYLYMYDAGTVQGFMGSNFLSYPPNSGINSNGIELDSGSIPNAPIVNGAAALQAIADVTTAVGIMNTLPNPYGIIPVNVPTIASGDQDLNTILLNDAPTDDYINVYKISSDPFVSAGNLTMSGDVDFTVNASTVCIFIVEGNITINYNIIRTGGILPQNIIFIANGSMDIYNNVTVSGIYISTGDYAYIGDSALTGRLICTSEINDGYSSNENSTITAP